MEAPLLGRTIDFGHSFVTFRSPRRFDARLQLDAVCTWIDDKTGATQTYYLDASCRSEDMFLDTNLFKMPNFEFRGIWTLREALIMKTFSINSLDEQEYCVGERERFANVRVSVRAFASSKELTGADAIRAATLDGLPLIGETDVRDEQLQQHGLLQYPIKTVNVLESPLRFQVDTGPLLTPDFTSAAQHPIQRLDIAHLVYNTFDKAEFVLRKPTPCGELQDLAHCTTDYSLSKVYPARHRIFCGTLD